jgi:hypothetical protein
MLVHAGKIVVAVVKSLLDYKHVEGRRSSKAGRCMTMYYDMMYVFYYRWMLRWLCDVVVGCGGREVRHDRNQHRKMESNVKIAQFLSSDILTL